MKTAALICLLLLLVGVHNEALQLFSVSSSPTSAVVPSGSVRGGTTIYIKGLGFSTNAADNKVFVGTYPCNIPADGATETTLACVTSDTGQLNDLAIQPIIVQSNGQQQSLTKEQGRFDYLKSRTPIIQALFPASAIAGTYVNFYGVHRIVYLGDGQRNMGDVKSMLIGNTQCSRFDILQANITADSSQTISCYQASIQQAGKYSVQEYLNTPGYSTPSNRLQRSSFKQEYYNYVVLPSVSSLSPTSGAVAGQQLTITGTGFSTISSNIAVTVDGTNCDVASSTITSITCNLRQKDTSATAKIGTTNAGTQANGYFSGTGLKYSRYNISNLGNKTPAGLRAAIASSSATIVSIQQGYRGQILTGADYYGSYFGQSFTGYFTAPVSGIYTFRGVADDTFAMYLSTSHGTTNQPAANPFIYSNTVQDQFSFYKIYVSTAENTVSLQQGQSYYIQVYHINFEKAGHLKVSVEVPNNDNTLTWQTHAVHRLDLNYTNQPQIVDFNQTGGTGGSINLTFTTKLAGLAPKVAAVVVPFDATITQFIAALNTISCFSLYKISGVLTTYDANGTVTTDPLAAYTYNWRVSIYYLRNATDLKTTFKAYFISYSGKQNCTQSTYQSHGLQITGTFELSIAGYQVRSTITSNLLMYSTSAATLQSAFNTIQGLQKVQVELLSDYNYNKYSSSWLISYYGCNFAIPPLVFSDTSLNGGVVGTKPQLFFTEIRPYNSNLLVDPIDYPFLSMPSSQPNVLVTVNGVPSVCTGNCAYAFLTDAPTLTTDSISGSILTLSLTDPSNINYNLNDVSVVFAGQTCTILNAGTSPISNFQCQLPINSDSTPTIQAGSYTPSVTVKQTGLVIVAPAVQPINFPLTLTTLNITSGGTNGGYGILLTGVGFPTDLSSATITICGQKALIQQISNIKASIIMPSCSQTGPQLITISNGIQTSNTLSFTYQSSTPAAQIFTVTPQSANPALKGVMVITGVGFGTDSSKVNLYLSNASGIAYNMRIIKLNDTYIQAGIPGGLPGSFKVQVNIIGIGMALPNSSNCNDFTYQLVINSITPTSGSYNGGTLINLKGINFAPSLDETLVFVGNALNWQCNVVSLNTTDILCRTPSVGPGYNISLPQPVVLTNRLMVDNTCSNANSCQFSYIPAASSPTLTGMSANTITSGSITLTGTNLNLATPLVVLTNKETGVVTVTNTTSSSDTSVTFIVPNVESGSYNVAVRQDPIGESNGFLLNIATASAAASPSLLSTNGGNVVISGTGLPASWPNVNFVLNILVNKVYVQPNIVSTNPSALTIALPASKAGSVFSIALTSPLGTTLSYSVTSSTASTPLLTLATTSSTSPGSIVFNFTQNNLPTVTPTSVSVYSVYNPSETYSITGSTKATGSVQFTATLTGGLYGFKFFFASYGWATCTSTASISTVAPSSTSISTSYNGGFLTLTGAGLSTSGTVTVNGVPTQLQNVTSAGAVAVIPPFVTSLSQQQYSLAEPQTLNQAQFAIISDTPDQQTLGFDGVMGTTYVSSSNGICYLGINVRNAMALNLTRIRFFPYSKWLIASTYLTGAHFEASNDGTAWTTIATVQSTVHSGWNIVPIKSSVYYQYYRFVHDTTSYCQLAELQFQGILLTDVTLSSLASNSASVVYNDGANSFSLPNQIEFRQDNTPVVNTLSKLNGDVFGGYPLTLNGNYLNFDTPSIIIDGIPCVVTNSTATAVTCTVGARLSLPHHNSFIVQVGSTNAIVYQSFSYVLRWSDIRTWGTDLPPVAGDFVFVPAGMNLLVDQSTPILKGILVQNGTITFADESDIVISTGLITLTGGKFIAGTEKTPYQHKLTFVMYGSYYGAQQPMFGNKGIGCLECYISMHGKPRQYTWTVLSATANIGATTITVKDSVDWKVGEQIVIASTDFDHYQAEQRTITSITGNSITLNASLTNMHYSAIQTYGSDQIEMRAEVGLLTRNIKMMGESTSQATSYGSHLLMAGSSENGLVGQIAYTEFTDCGQPLIIGRYCIHYHMVGDASESYARGNAVHHSMARVVTLHGVHYLRVEYNVGYRVKGHNFFVEDGIETNNLIQYNLAISSMQAWTMLQTDISVASYWITHPSNHLMHNHAAGSDFYGFWYQIKSRPDGPSACTDVCPIGNALGSTHNNTAHSNVRFGLRIFKLAPRTYPCRALYAADLINPWKDNPPVVSTFSDFTLYKNGVSGLLAEETANLVFTNFKTAQNKRSGAEFYTVDFTPNITSFQNSVVVGITQNNNPSDVTGSRGIITPNLGNIRIDNIRFYNYPANTHSLETCNNCHDPLLFSNSVQEIFISNISYTNVTGNKLFMNGAKREILYDLDGTFTTTAFDGRQRSSAAVVNNYKHLASDPACLPTTNSNQWDTTIACDSSVKVARVTFSALAPANTFLGIQMKAQPIASLTDTVPETSTSFSQVYSGFSSTNTMQPMFSLRKSFSLPFITGKIYNIWWLTGMDFDHLSMSSSYTLTANDLPIRFKFNYTLNREMYDIGPIRPGETFNSSSLFTPKNNFLDNTCYNGEYFHNNSVGDRTLQLCASPLSKTYFETTDVSAIFCRYLCPAPPGQFVKETFVRYWSNITQWPLGRMPLPGENVTVNGNWTILMDVDPAAAQFLTIDGTVIIPDTQDRNIESNAIWIRAGSLQAGLAATPFTHKLNIQINGLKNDPGYVFDPSLVGNKIFVVTGTLSLYGVSPTDISANLTASAFKGDTSLTVDTANGWAIGDEIVIAPSFSSSRQYERVTITNVNGNTISFAPALQYTHYGAPSVTISNSYGTLDTRASVGHVTRNIKIISGPDAGWGYSLVIYSMYEEPGTIYRAGQATLNSVEFTLGGQYDTPAASLVLSNNGDTTRGQTIITRSSFSFCRSYCIAANSHNNNLISYNVFYEARKFHLQADSVTLFTVSSNVMIGAIARPTVSGKEAVACIALTGTDPVANVIMFNNNICQGSDVDGYVFPFVPCGNTSPFIQNTVGSARIGFLLNGEGQGGCLSFTGVRAYSCTIGQMSSPPNTASLTFSNFIMADNGRAVTLRFGLESSDKTATFSNSYITMISRPNCAECYGPAATDCQGNHAIRMLATTINGQSYPMAFDFDFDVICRHQTFDSKTFMKNVQFDYFKQSYSESALQQCGNNVIFRPHSGAPDMTGSTHLWDTTCTNCQLNSMAYFDQPLQSEATWFGGCGNMVCTGKVNYIIEDHTNTLLPQGGTLIPNNVPIGSNTPLCTYNSFLNGYYCTRNDFAVLAYENIATDFNKRVMWPVSLSYDGGNWTTKTNGFKEWEWAGGEPLNLRLGRFVSIIQLHKIYNMSFASNPPTDMRMQLQKKIPGGNNSDYIIVKIYYPFPNSIQIQVNGVTIAPISLLDNNAQNKLDTTSCGSNIFYYFNYTIHFVVTGAQNCLVRITMTNSVQLTLHFAMNINTFFSSNGPTRLVDRMCAILQISDQSQVKIVGIFNGSTIVIVAINAPTVDSSTSQSQDNSASSLPTVQGWANTINAKQVDATLAPEIGLGDLLSVKTAILPVTPKEESSSKSEDNTNVIIIAVVVTVVSIIIIVAVVLIILKKKANNKIAVEELPPYSTSSEGGKEAANSIKVKGEQKSDLNIVNITSDNINDNISEVIFENRN